MLNGIEEFTSNNSVIKEFIAVLNAVREFITGKNYYKGENFNSKKSGKQLIKTNVMLQKMLVTN